MQRIESKYLLVFLVLLVGMSFVCGVGISGNVVFDKEEFRVDTIFLKNMIKQGESVSSGLRISNSGDVSSEFSLRVEGVNDMANLSETSFSVGAGESKSVEVLFYGDDKEPGVYVGKLIVEAGSEKVIPIILEVQSENVLFATNLEVAASYKEVFQGGDVSVSTRLFNLNDTFLHDVTMSYFVKGFGGETIVAEVETTVVGTEVSVSKSVVLPADVEFGDYAFIVVSRFEDSVSTSSYLFSVVEDEEEESFAMGDFGYFALIVVVFLVLIVMLIIYLMYERNQMFRELRAQNRAELKMCMGTLMEKRRVSMAKVKGRTARREVVRRFVRDRSVAVRELKSRHKKQRKEFRKLIKNHKKDAMKRKLGEWKKQGFKFGNEVGKMSFSKKGRVDRMSKWKGQGFKI